MTLHKLMLWFLGLSAVVFVGATGATVYQVLSPRQAGVASAVAPEPFPGVTPTAPATIVAAEPLPVEPATTPAVAPLAQPATVPDRASPPGRPVAKRSARPVVAARHPVVRPYQPAAATAQRQVPSYRPGGYVAPWQPTAVYRLPPPASYYGYPGYVGYRPYTAYRTYAYYPAY